MCVEVEGESRFVVTFCEQKARASFYFSIKAQKFCSDCLAKFTKIPEDDLLISLYKTYFLARFVIFSQEALIRICYHFSRFVDDFLL